MMPRRSAAHLFRLGASWGHVDCAYQLGLLSAEGKGVERSASFAAKTLLVVAQVGAWARKVLSVCLHKTLGYIMDKPNHA